MQRMDGAKRGSERDSVAAVPPSDLEQFWCQDPMAMDLGSGLLGLNPRVQPGRKQWGWALTVCMI